MLLIIIALVLIAIFILTTMIHLEHKFKAIKAVVLVLILLIIGGSLYTWIKSDTNDLSSPRGIVNSIYAYMGWMGDISIKVFSTFSDGFKTVGNVIQGNETQQLSNKLFDGRK